jgi:hypothetical protein
MTILFLYLCKSPSSKSRFSYYIWFFSTNTVAMATLSSDILLTVIILWVFTCAAMFIMTLRLIMRKVQKQRFEVSDYVTMACMFFLLSRSAIDHVAIILGTNDVTEAFRASHKFTTNDIYRREVGSKLIIIDRLIYNS